MYHPVKHLPGHGGQHFYPPRIACFVCGAEVPADYPLYTEPQSMGKPFFPFLRHHIPPLGCHAPEPGEVAKSCRVCYSALMRQWEEFDVGRVPVEKRVYWIKRLDGQPFPSPESQLSAAGQVLGAERIMAAPPMPRTVSPAEVLPSRSPVPIEKDVSKQRPPSRPYPAPAEDHNDNDSGALDLSSGSRERETMKSRSSVTSAVSHHSSYQSEGASSSTDILDLTLPDKNATFEVCYVCGDEFKKGTLTYCFAKQVSSSDPFYPSLMHHPRPPRSRPMDSAGRVQTCEECYHHLFQQWLKFEDDSVPHPDRNYALRKRSAPIIDTTTFVCYNCALDYHSSSLRLLYTRPNTENEPYYPFIEDQKPPPGASPVSPQGMVQVCTVCYKSVKENHHGFLRAEQPPPKKRRTHGSRSLPREPEVVGDLVQPDDDDKMMPSDITCPLCRRKFSIFSFKLLHTHPSPTGNVPHFPFLSLLPKPEEIVDIDEPADKQRVRVCQACTTSLINQWATYEREKKAVDERQYFYQSLTGPRSSGRCSLRSSPPPRPRTHSPTSLSQKSGDPHPPATPSKLERPRSDSNQFGEMPPVSRTRSNTMESKPRSESGTAPHPNPPTCHSPSASINSVASADPAVGTQKTTSGSSFYCFLCGLHSELSFSRVLYSLAAGKKAPYFPFMKDHVPKSRAETLREDGTALVCTFCYHSVMVQWSKYNEGSRIQQVEPGKRAYNLHDYVCYVCGVTTYRKRIRALRVMDFPFLRHHTTRNKDAITLENGEMVAVCLDCFDSLRGQYSEGAKYGIPVEKRQYNWIQIPPPPEDGSTAHIVTPQERLQKASHVHAPPAVS